MTMEMEKQREIIWRHKSHLTELSRKSDVLRVIDQQMIKFRYNKRI